MAAQSASTLPAYTDDDVVIGEGVALTIPAAGWLLRSGSALIDAVVILIGYALSLIALTYLITVYETQTGFAANIAWFPVVQVAWAALWFMLVPLLIEVFSGGRSLGKLVFGLRIVRDDGGAIGFRHSFVRALMGLVEIYGTVGSMAALVGLFNPRAKRFGDMLAGTYAQYERAPMPQPLMLQLPPQLVNWAALADVTRLPDPLARRIRDYFLQYERLTPAARTHFAGDLARRAKPYVHPIPDVDAHTFLTGVTVVRHQRELRPPRMPLPQSNPHGFPQRG